MSGMGDVRRRFFDERAAAWMDTWYFNPETGRYDRHAEKFDRLFRLAPVATGEKVLDAGCGSGVLVPHLLERIGPDGRVYEVDYAAGMIAENRRLHPDPRIIFHVADVLAMPLQDAACDVVICFSCFPHFADKPAATRELARVLRPGGRILVAHFDSSADINRHHRKAEAVMHDHLPDAAEMCFLFRCAGIVPGLCLDEDGFYLVLGSRP